MSIPEVRREPHGARGEGKVGLMAALLLLVLCAVPVIAQHRGSGSGSGTAVATQQPYAALLEREVASLAADQLAGLRAGHGLGFALPAELSGRYPGPLHILELADKLVLSPEQRAAVRKSFDAMQARAVAAGAAYIEAEKRVDLAFRQGATGGPEWRELVKAADLARADVRLAHLAAHVEMAALLSDEQKRRYAELRGYAR